MRVALLIYMYEHVRENVAPVTSVMHDREFDLRLLPRTFPLSNSNSYVTCVRKRDAVRRAQFDPTSDGIQLAWVSAWLSGPASFCNASLMGSASISTTTSKNPNQTTTQRADLGSTAPKARAC